MNINTFGNQTKTFQSKIWTQNTNSKILLFQQRKTTISMEVNTKQQKIQQKQSNHPFITNTPQYWLIST